MESQKISPTIENYLSTLFVLERDGEPVVGARLAELLGVTPPTVTNTLKRMERDGLIDMKDPHGAHLTDSGRAAARSVMRRHMLTEWLLSPLLSWSKVHSEAHAIEHALSSEVEAALQRQLNNPVLCPHGNPLPGHEAEVAAWVALTHIPAGETVVLRRIHEVAEETPNLLAFLEENGLVVGCALTVERLLPFNQTLDVRAGERTVSLGLATARYLFVERSAAA